MSLLASIFGALNFATIGTETLKNKRFASTGARFSQNQFFRLAIEFYRKMTSQTLHFGSQKSPKFVKNREKALNIAKKGEVKRYDAT